MVEATLKVFVMVMAMVSIVTGTSWGEATNGQPKGAPSPTIEIPGGKKNASQFEYVPERQPTWIYEQPGNLEDACAMENAVLQDQLRDKDLQLLEAADQIRVLHAQLSVLQKKTVSP